MVTYLSKHWNRSVARKMQKTIPSLVLTQNAISGQWLFMQEWICVARELSTQSEARWLYLYNFRKYEHMGLLPVTKVFYKLALFNSIAWLCHFKVNKYFKHCWKFSKLTNQCLIIHLDRRSNINVQSEQKCTGNTKGFQACSCSLTVWKYKNYSATQILCKINLGELNKKITIGCLNPARSSFTILLFHLSGWMTEFCNSRFVNNDFT